VIVISEIEHNYKKEIEERFRSENSEEFNIEKKEIKNKLKLVALILSGIGGILYLITVFIVLDSSMWAYPNVSMPFLIAGVISLMGTITGVKNIKIGSVVILLSLPVTFLIGLMFSPYWHFYFYFITYVFVPIPLPHSVFVIIGGILCLKSSDWKII